jgi:putative transposase
MLLGFRTKLKLNQSQRKLMAQHAGYSRWVYNWGLATKIRLYQEGIKIKTNELKKFYTNYVKPNNPWQSTLSSRVYQFAFRDLDTAYSKFFQGLGKFPRFKKKGKNDSFTLDAGGKLIPIGGTRIKLPFIGWVNTFEGCPETAVKKITISKLAGDWYISFAFEQEREKPQQLMTETIGIDLGISAWATLSNAEVFSSIKPYRQLQEKLSRLQYLNRHKVIGSSNWRKAQLKIARLHRRISNIRRDYLHKMTNYIAKTWSKVSIEDLCVIGMLANRKLSKAVADQAFYEFRRQLEYKCPLYGSELVVVNRFYPSSKTCSNCQDIKQDLTLSARWFTCNNCGVFLPRDWNASINLARYADGLSVSQRGLGISPSGATGVKASGVVNADITTVKEEVKLGLY